jgi:hypothetical protein
VQDHTVQGHTAARTLRHDSRVPQPAP